MGTEYLGGMSEGIDSQTPTHERQMWNSLTAAQKAKIVEVYNAGNGSGMTPPFDEHGIEQYVNSIREGDQFKDERERFAQIVQLARKEVQ